MSGARIAERLRLLSDEVPAKFLAFGPDGWTAVPGSGWTKQEILGHLIDSAVNNLHRFTRAQVEPEPYPVVAYPQVDLVRINRYAGRPAERAAALWRELNPQIAGVVDAFDSAAEARRVTLPDGAESTLGWLAADYLDHMEAHLRDMGL